MESKTIQNETFTMFWSMSKEPFLAAAERGVEELEKLRRVEKKKGKKGQEVASWT